MKNNLEQERKWLVKPPTSWSALSEIFEDLIDICRISQTYLKHDKDEQSPRVRKTIKGLIGDTGVVYHYNQKKTISTGVHKEKEYEISSTQYKNYLKKALPNKVEVQKTRFVFKFNDQTFELDIFKGPLRGLAIMEIELKDIKKDKVELPHFLKVIKEVTGDKKFSNYSLADKRAK